MPQARRSRVIAADRDAVWRGRLRPVPPAALVAEGDPRRGRARAPARQRAPSGPKVLETTSGKGVRADFRCLLLARATRAMPGSRRSRTRPFAKVLQVLGHHASSWSDARRRHAGDDRARPAAARDVAARRVHAEARDRRPARRGARRARAACRSAGEEADEPPEPAAADEVVGVGRPGHRGEAAARRRSRRCAPSSGAGPRARRPCALEEVRARRARACRPSARRGSRTSVGEEWVREDRLSRVTHAAGKGYPDLVRMRTGAAEAAPGRGRLPGAARTRCGALLDAVRQRAGRRRPVRRRHERRRRRRAAARRAATRWSPSTWAGSRSLDGRRPRSLTAVLGAGLRGPAVEARAWPARAHARPLPPVVRVRDASADGSRPARPARPRPGYGSDREARLRPALRRAGGRDRAAQPLPATAAGPGLRQLLVGSEGVLGVITEATLKVRPRPAERRYEGWMFRAFEQGAEAFRALEQRGTCARRRAAARRGRDAPVDDARRRRLAARSARAARYIGARGYVERLPRDPRLRGRARRRRRGAGARRARADAPRRRPVARRGAGPRLGARRATRARTCATRCSTTA